MMKMIKTIALTAVALPFVAFGCASTPEPVTQLTATQSAIRAADEMNAQQTPAAALHLKMARDQVKTAQALIAEEENERAKVVLERAHLDAELAVELAREEKTRRQAEAARQRVIELQAEAE